MIDLHTHTNRSDGTVTPAELIAHARSRGVTLLGITDHDTFEGFDEAAPYAREAGLELVCGIELSTKYQGQSVHLLAYYLDGVPEAMRQWIRELQASREERNLGLIERLQAGGFAVTLEEVRAKSTRMMGRPHFARVLVEKGYASSMQDAFDRFLDKSAPFYVDREEPQLTECVRMVHRHGGIPSLAHPCRFPFALERELPLLVDSGLEAIEAYHSDHTPGQTAQYLACAQRYALGVTGGSDFHGEAKAEVSLGTGRNGNLHIPADLLERLKETVKRRRANESCAGQEESGGLLSFTA